jgi:hypothetical protein
MQATTFSTTTTDVMVAKVVVVHMLARTSVLGLLVTTWRTASQQSTLRLPTSLHGVALATRMFSWFDARAVAHNS